MALRALLFALLIHALCHGAGCSRVLRVPFEQWPPYSFIGGGGKPTGLEVEILEAVAHEAGCQVAWQFDFPRMRRWLYFTSGEIDMLLAATNNYAPARQSAAFSRPYRPEMISAFTLGDSPPLPHTDSFRDMLDHRVSLIAQTGSDRDSPLFGEFLQAKLVTRYEEYDKALVLLAHHRGDVLIGDRWAIEYAAKAANVPLRRLKVEVLTDQVTYMLSRKSLTDADYRSIDDAIVRLGNDGTLERIRLRWLGP